MNPVSKEGRVSHNRRKDQYTKSQLALTIVFGKVNPLGEKEHIKPITDAPLFYLYTLPIDYSHGSEGRVTRNRVDGFETVIPFTSTTKSQTVSDNLPHYRINYLF